MYTSNLQVSNYNDRHYRVNINASWITVYDKDNNIVVKRHADEGLWYDMPHRKIVDALGDLEKAIFELVDTMK